MDRKKKLIVAFLGLLMSIVVITTASLAWFSLSTNPETSGIQVGLSVSKALLISKDGENWDESINVSESFSGLAALHPVSTADGTNWYLPTYDEKTGSINDPEEFTLDNTLKYANVLQSTVESTSGMQGYYVYTDIWLKTEEENGCDVNLSVPHTFTDGGNSQSGLEDFEITRGVYGSYVLDNYAYDETTSSVKDCGYGVQNTIRIGLLVNPTTYKSSSGTIDSDPGYTNSYSGNVFYVYEPNSDSRTAYNGQSPYSDGSYFKPSGSGNTYISGFDLADSFYASGSGQYFVTEPIGYDESNSGKGELSNYADGKLIVQTTSTWNTSKVEETLASGQSLNSNQVATMGSFIKSVSGAYTSTSSGRSFSLDTVEKQVGSQTLIHLDKDTPVKVRVFIWIEGQDVDCWNDVAGGQFIVNLELAGQVTN